MGKKRLRKKYTSKGTGDGQSWDVTKQCRRDRTSAEKILYKLDAWEKGLNPWVAVASSSAHTNKPFVKIRANDYWGNPKDCWSMSNITKKKENATAPAVVD